MKIYLKLEAPFEWVRVSANKVVSFGEVPELVDYQIGDEDDVIGVVDGEWVTSHRVNLPAKTRKQFNAALPYSLEESISEEVENMHFICSSWKAGQESQVSVVSKLKMIEWKKLAMDNRLPVRQLVPDHSLVPFHEAADCSLALVGNQLLANHRNGTSVSIDQNFIDVWLMDVPTSDVIAVNNEELTEKLIAKEPDRDIRFWDFGSKLSHWLEYDQALAIDLWSETYRPRVSRRSNAMFVVPGLILVLSVFLKFGFDGYRYIALHAEIGSIQAESQAILSKHFPVFNDVAPGAEREILERAIARIGGPDKSNSVHNWLAQVSFILSQQRLTLLDIAYRNEELIITCLLNDFSQVDLLNRQFNGRPGFSATLQSSASEGGKIIASYSIKAREG
jgi:type II secretion system protein L